MNCKSNLSQKEKIEIENIVEIESKVNLTNPMMFGSFLPAKLNYWKLPKCSLEHMAAWMLHIQACPVATFRAGGTTPAGYTYLGQMITHDIVRSTTSPNSRKVTPWLNLDSIYPDLSDPAINDYLDEKGHFRLGANKDSCNDCWDYARDDDSGKAYILETRNDENIILAQIVVQWMKFHNRAIDYLLSRTQQGSKSDLEFRAKNYRKARIFGILVFQTLVVNDYLKQILQESVYSHYFDHRCFLRGSTRATYNSFKSASDQVPIEFSHAAFRFGHSMVRDKYNLTRVTLVKLMEIFKRNVIIPENRKMDWNLFFFLESKSKPFDDKINPASPINIFLATALGAVPLDKQNPKQKPHDTFAHELLTHYLENPEINCLDLLNRCNIDLTGATEGMMNMAVQDMRTSAEIPTASDIFCAIRADTKNSKMMSKIMGLDLDRLDEHNKIVCGVSPDAKFSNHKLVEDIDGKIDVVHMNNIPLWLYVLMESSELPLYREESNGDDQRSNLNRLGPLGSVIIADVLCASIADAEISIYKNKEHRRDLGELYISLCSLDEISRNERFSFRHIPKFNFGDQK